MSSKAPSCPSFCTARALTVAVLLSATLLAGCASSKKKDDYVEKPVAELYNTAVDSLEKQDYEEAAKSFDAVERQHPYSKWATKAQLMAAYSYYQNSKYDDALIAIDRFIQLHPGNSDTPYAYYLKALCYYEQISDVGRDQKMTVMAMHALQDVVTRFPNTTYSRDARIKIDLTRDHLAGKEMAVGRWYMTQQQYLAAINRFRTVVEKYQQTTHVPEALYRLVEAYSMLGLKHEAQKAAAVLGHNFPGSEWYQDAYDIAALGSKDPDATENKKLDSGDDEDWLSHVF